MVYWSPNLFVESKLLGKEKEIAENLQFGKRQKDIYCILLPQNPANLFEIMHINEMQFSYYKNRDMYILGLAGSHKGAVIMVCKIIAEAYKESKQPDIRSKYHNICQWKQVPNN